MTKVDEILSAAVEAGDVPLVIAMADTAAGVTYSGASAVLLPVRLPACIFGIAECSRRQVIWRADQASRAECRA